MKINNMIELKKIGIVGLGYVGLPLAVEFGKKYQTIGYDISEKRVMMCASGIDETGEVDKNRLSEASNLKFTSNQECFSECDVIIIAVPTPVDLAKKPDFQPLIAASMMVAKRMRKGAIIVYESTVYPGATEEVCIPILEKYSGMKWKIGFNVGYSPERVNPGDKERTLSKIVKVVSGDSQGTLEILSELYGSIIKAGIHKAQSIKIAEASKVIENTQRDLNIALMNELAILFEKIGIDTLDVLEAAGTKWNFLPFRPGLVGGHCIGVDPYYLTHKAEMVGYHPQVILAGRRINDELPKFLAERLIKTMSKVRGCSARDSIIVLGVTFKENCSDLRNSKVVDLIKYIESFGPRVYVHDPVAQKDVAEAEYGISLVEWDNLPSDASGIVVAVAHDKYKDIKPSTFSSLLIDGGVIMDVKSIYKNLELEALGYKVVRL